MKPLANPLGTLGLLLVLTMLVTGIFAPFIAPYDYTAQDIPHRLQGPSPQYPLGTDHLGRDLLSRIIYGARIALMTALPAIAIALAAGITLGLLAGYLGGLVDTVIVLLLDTFQAFPGIALALVILVLLGQSLVNTVIVIGLAFTPGYARVIRAQVLSARQQLYVDAERSLGAANQRIIAFHILPNVLPSLLILAAMDLPSVITFEAGLSFLGLGVRPPTPSWGVMLAEGFNYIRQSPWEIIWAGTALVVSTLGFTLLGEALRDLLDPRLSGTRGA